MDQTKAVTASGFAPAHVSNDRVIVCCDPVKPLTSAQKLLYVSAAQDDLVWISSTADAPAGPLIEKDIPLYPCEDAAVQGSVS